MKNKQARTRDPNRDEILKHNKQNKQATEEHSSKHLSNILKHIKQYYILFRDIYIYNIHKTVEKYKRINSKFRTLVTSGRVGKEMIREKFQLNRK